MTAAAEVELAVEWGQLVLLADNRAPAGRVVRLLGRLGIPAAAFRRRDGTVRTRTDREDWTMPEVLALTGQLRGLGLAVAMRPGVISTVRERRQGRPSAIFTLRETQRTIAAFTFEEDGATVAGGERAEVVGGLLERMGWNRYGNAVTLTGRGGHVVVLVLVEFDTGPRAAPQSGVARRAGRLRSDDGLVG